MMGVSIFDAEAARREYERGVKDALAGTVEPASEKAQPEAEAACSAIVGHGVGTIYDGEVA